MKMLFYVLGIITVFLFLSAIYIMTTYDGQNYTDKQFVLCIIGGMGMACATFLVESVMIVPKNNYQYQNRETRINSCITGILASIFLIVFILLM